MLSERGQLMAMGAHAELQHFLPLVRRVIAQTRARVFHGDLHYHNKLFSLFESHTEAIRNGKASKPTEFGKLVKIQEAENQMVIDYQIDERRPEDRTLVVPTIDAHQRVFGQVPRLLAADRGFWSPANQRRGKAGGSQKGLHSRAGQTRAGASSPAASTLVPARPAPARRLRRSDQRSQTP